MNRYKYKAINRRGRPIHGVMSAVNEIDLHSQLQTAGYELLQCSLMNQKGFLSRFGLTRKVTVRDLIQIFLHLEQMQSAGVPLLSALSDIRDSIEHPTLRDIMTEIHREVSEGKPLSQAMAMHPKAFPNLCVSLVSSGEETGDMTAIYRQLIKYLKWVDQMQSKVRKATRYPMIVTGVVLVMVIVMMAVVVPQIVGFIRSQNQDPPIYTTALIATSDFFVSYWWAILLLPIITIGLINFLRRTSEDVAYKIDLLILNLPVMGPLIRKINIARFAQTFGALFAGGIDILRALEAAQQTVTNRALAEALDDVRQKVKAGAPLSQAFVATGEFPTMVVRMMKVGEESGNLTAVLDQVAEFYTNDVDEAIQGLIAMIEPFLTAFMGGMILWIAVAVFGPIYSSFENLDI